MFVDYMKASDKVDREKLWNIMKKRGIPFYLIKITQIYRDR